MTADTLGDALPREMARVTALIPDYAALPQMAGALAIAMMRQDLDRAARALASGDIAEMMRAYQSLKGFTS